MIPNNQPDADTRFRKLVEAIKFVYASTFFRAAKSYIRATDRTSADEKMAVIIQEVVGDAPRRPLLPRPVRRRPLLQLLPGAGRRARGTAWSTWPSAWARRSSTAALSWTYSPARPKAPPPFGSARELAALDPARLLGGEHGPAARPTIPMRRDRVPGAGRSGGGGLRRHAGRRRLDLRCRGGTASCPGTGVDGPAGPRLRAAAGRTATLPLNDLIRELLSARRARPSGEAVEIEFAVTPAPAKGRRAALRLPAGAARCSSPRRRSRSPTTSWPARTCCSPPTGSWATASLETIRDVVYVKPEPFESRLHPADRRRASSS